MSRTFLVSVQVFPLFQMYLSMKVKHRDISSEPDISSEQVSCRPIARFRVASSWSQSGFEAKSRKSPILRGELERE